jgi:hypothetical protein
MKREVRWMNAVLTGALLLVGATVGQAQETQEAPPPGPVMIQGGMAAEGDVFFADKVELLGFGGWLHGGKVVKGAPFSAVAVSETTQTLADGNHIARKTQTSLFRDSQGRFRREVTLPAIGPLAASGQPHSFVHISDPVAGTDYVLEPDQKVARQMPGRMAMGVTTKGGPGGPGEVLYRKFKTGSTNATVKTESLGAQTIDGMNTEGTRTTRTIPAGEIGNEQPITIVSERWYSADLQMDVKSTHTDPRFGTTTYTLTNIQRMEPAASLFAVPSDYSIEQGHKGKFLMNGAPPPPPDN